VPSSAYNHKHCVVCGSAIYPPYADALGEPPLCSDRCREVWQKMGSQVAPLHKHCVVCGRPLSAMYVAPSEPPLCSMDCRAKYEGQRARAARWQSLFNIVLILMLLWLLASLFASLIPSLPRP
jgi:predicted nucleic acid-binding Zn ribbon protein